MRREPFERLRRRAEFVAVAKGVRSNNDSVGVQTRRRAADSAAPRFGITITKRTAPRSVDRNRMRRRLREALRLGAALSGAEGHDYVIVGRLPVLTIPFDTLRAALDDTIAAATRRSQRPDRKTVQRG